MEQIATYLNDHLAGSVAALELLRDLMKRYRGESMESFFAALHRDIEADQDVLRSLLDRTRQRESWFRKGAAWFAEKLVRSKFKIAGQHRGGLGLVQALETLALGIRGKELLWQALAASRPSLAQNVDLAMLIRRAVEQRQRVEEKRLDAAIEAFR